MSQATLQTARNLICFHHNLHNLLGFFVDEKSVPANITTITATDSAFRQNITTNLVRNNKGFVGKPVIKSMLLKGITVPKIMPTITVAHDRMDEITLSLDVGGVSFTQQFKKSNHHVTDRPVFFGQMLLDDTYHRVMETNNRFLPNPFARDYPVLSPRYIELTLKQGQFKIRSDKHNALLTVVTETSNKNIEKVRNCGLVLKRTVTYFNKEKKEDISYYVITATGRIMVFEGENTTFETPDKTGYVLLANPVKVK